MMYHNRKNSTKKIFKNKKKEQDRERERERENKLHTSLLLKKVLDITVISYHIISYYIIYFPFINPYRIT